LLAIIFLYPDIPLPFLSVIRAHLIWTKEIVYVYFSHFSNPLTFPIEIWDINTSPRNWDTTHFLLAYLIMDYLKAGFFDNTLLLTLCGGWLVCILTRLYYEWRM
jgi:hypothetical protein